MTWIIVGIALAGLVAVGVLANSVRHKLADVVQELEVLNQRRTELDELTGRLQLPHRSGK